ncbi:MAG: hypothetical protein K2N35_09700 [Muribaculaceae bacterium]|nr:hypothetical protein [Muribaculaceae bacterium]
MNTKPLNNSISNGNGNGKKWTYSSIAAAVAAGAISVEAANILYDELKKESTPDADTTPEPSPILEADPTQEPSSNQPPNPSETSNVTDNPPTAPQSGSEPAPEPEPIPEPDPEPVPELNPEPEREPVPEPDPDPEPEPEPVPEPDPEPEREPIPAPDPSDIVDVIVEEIDPQDIDLEDILLVDDIGTVYTVEGNELNAALVHDQDGNQRIIMDVDGDRVYDLVATPEGEVIAQLPGDIDVSDVELMYAQQHGHTEYIAPNEFDIAMNEDNPNIQSDISLT